MTGKIELTLGLLLVNSMSMETFQGLSLNLFLNLSCSSRWGSQNFLPSNSVSKRGREGWEETLARLGEHPAPMVSMMSGSSVVPQSLMGGGGGGAKSPAIASRSRTWERLASAGQHLLHEWCHPVPYQHNVHLQVFAEGSRRGDLGTSCQCFHRAAMKLWEGNEHI